MKRGHRGSGCRFMIAIVIIVASNGNSEPAWLETSSAAPVGGDVHDPLGLDPPPDLVEELEQREDRLGELLVEAPLVLVVVALQPADERARPPRAAAGGSELAALAGSRPCSSPTRTPAQEVAQNSATARAEAVVHRPTRSSARLRRSPCRRDRAGMQRGTHPAPGRLRQRSRGSRPPRRGAAR